MNRLSITASVLLCSFALTSKVYAQEIKFETADGKFKITGTVGYYVANGKPVDSPKGGEKGLAVVIIRPDGKATNPVPVKLLSGITKRKLFSGATVSENKILSRPPIKNSIGMELKLLPAGTFMMGSNFGQAHEQPVHKVTLSQNFYIGVHEVTQEQYEKVMGVNPSKFKGASNPVEQVTWTEAVEFCRKLSDLPSERDAGRMYRLPTEAEWEYACRAGTTTTFSFGSDESDLGDYAWVAENSGGESHPVGRKQPNAWGLYDMHGNVAEWCYNRHGVYPGYPVTDPEGPTTGAYRVTRSRGWLSKASVTSSAARGRGLLHYRHGNCGFRVACVSSGQ